MDIGTFLSSQTATICGNWNYIFNFNGHTLLQSYSTYNSNSKLWSIQSFDYLLADGSPYTIKVRAYQGTYSSHYKEQTYTVKVIDPCDSTQFVLPTISNIQYQIAQTEIVQSFAPFYDTLGICCSFTYTAVYQNQDPIDMTVFTFDFTNFEFKVYTADTFKYNVYNLQI